jgi:hypothetical protein
MATPLYSTDIIPLTSRPTLTVMDDGDYFVILDTSTGKISKILRTDVQKALNISYNNATSGLTATQVQAALDELVVNLGSSDSAISALGGRLDILEADELTEGSIAYDIKQASDALKGVGYTEGSLKTHEDRLDTLEGADTVSGSVAKTVKDAVEPIIEDVSDHEIRIQKLEFIPAVTSWADVQKVAKAGRASRYLKVGDLIKTTYDGSPAVVEVVGINQDTPVAGAPAYKDVISFHFKDCLQNAQYSAPQALYNAVEGLDAGSYTFINSNDSLPYTFTLTQAVPAGGVVVITSWGVGAYEPTVLKTMQEDRLTNVETGIAVTQASGGTALAPVNLTPRCRYGANLYIESGIRHFLNDNSESYLWAAQGLYDMPSTYGAGGGFLKRLDADFASVIGPVVKKVARATADGGGQDTMEDKVWLLSGVEMGYGTEGVTIGEQVYERWNGATNAERIKLLSGSPRSWWLRPPYVSNQGNARRVNTDGLLSSSSSSNSHGLAPGLAVY